MSTLGQMMDNLAVMLARSDLNGSLSATTRTAINRAVDHYKSDRFWLNEGRVSFSASSGATEYTLSASVLSIISVTVTQSGNTYPLRQISEEDRLAYNTADLSGTPNYFSVFGNRFIPYPAPNSDYTVEITCTRDQGSLSDTTSSNNWTNYAEQLIEARAAWWLNMFVFKSYEEAMTFAQLESNALDSLRARDHEKTPSRLTPTYF